MSLVEAKVFGIGSLAPKPNKQIHAAIELGLGQSLLYRYVDKGVALLLSCA